MDLLNLDGLKMVAFAFRSIGNFCFCSLDNGGNERKFYGKLCIVENVMKHDV